ncbi:hypothetical protein DsansV1_C02g0024051 [Dioscorea sansibarensis]
MHRLEDMWEVNNRRQTRRKRAHGLMPLKHSKRLNLNTVVLV